MYKPMSLCCKKRGTMRNRQEKSDKTEGKRYIGKVGGGRCSNRECAGLEALGSRRRFCYCLFSCKVKVKAP